MSSLGSSAGQNIQMGDLPTAKPLPVNTDGKVQSIVNDTLERAPFARRVAERITIAGSGPSIVFGLSGPWDSGKSSVLNIITEVLHNEHHPRWRVVKLSPWATSDLASLTDELYQSIAAAMGNTNKGRQAALEVDPAVRSMPERSQFNP